MAVKRPILTDEQVDELRRRFDVPVKSVIARTPEQRLAKSEKARTAREAKSPLDLDVKIARYASWVLGIQRLGVTVEWYEAKFAEQRGLCAVCGRTERVLHKQDGSVKRLAVDHNHVTGEARGLLCQHCNTQLGTLENREWRTRAEAYLASYERIELTLV